MRARVRRLPMQASVSKMPGLAALPVMATRKGWTTFLRGWPDSAK